MHGDGTFYMAAKYFYQLYLLDGWYSYYMIPCAWILMKAQLIIKKPFEQLKKLAITPKQIMTDRD